MSKENFKEGSKVYVSGAVNYGGKFYRVACNGVIQLVGKTKSLITLEEIDGDRSASVYVDNKIISSI